MKFEGIVKNIVQNKNNNTIYNVLIENTWYSHYGKPKFEKGSVISGEYKENGNFKNIDTKSVKIGINKQQSHDDLIVRQACLKACGFYSKNPIEHIKNAKLLFNSLKEEW